MRLSICPVCGKKHKTNELCIWDNLTVDPQNHDYFSKRQKEYQSLLEAVSKIKELRAEIDEKKHENECRSLELGELKRQIADVEKQIESTSRSINLVSQENELRELKSILDGFIQESTQLKNELKDVSDYNELKSYLTICKILISIHK